MRSILINELSFFCNIPWRFSARISALCGQPHSALNAFSLKRKKFEDPLQSSLLCSRFCDTKASSSLGVARPGPWPHLALVPTDENRHLRAVSVSNCALLVGTESLLTRCSLLEGWKELIRTSGSWI